MAQDPDIEVVYIGTINPLHYEVLIVKPLCMNEKQVQRLVEHAKQKNIFLMEAIWSRSFPSYHYIRQQIPSGMLGEILSVNVEFGFGFLADMEIVQKRKLGGGITVNKGVYTIQLCQWLVEQEPKMIKATGKLNDDGVDSEMSVELIYGPNKSAKMKASCRTECNTATIVGTHGQITIPSFWAPTTITDVDGQEMNWPLPEAKLEFNYTNSCGLRYEADETRKCTRAGKLGSENVSHNEII